MACRPRGRERGDGSPIYEPAELEERCVLVDCTTSAAMRLLLIEVQCRGMHVGLAKKLPLVEGPSD